MTDSSASSKPVSPVSDTAGERFDPLNYMIRDLEYGLRFSIENQGRDPADDSTIYEAPVNWTHGKIRAWIKALKEARGKAMGDTAGELTRLLRHVIKSTESHIDGRDLLAELHPRRMLDIKRRVDGRETWHEGDWLSGLHEAVQEAREFLDGPHFVTVTASDFNGHSFDGLPFNPFTKWVQMAMLNRRIEMYRDNRDYAVWIVESKGGRLLAYPGDTIHNVNGDLVLAQDPGNMSEPRQPDPRRTFDGVGSMGSGISSPAATPDKGQG